MVLIVWKLDLQLPVQWVPITTLRCDFESRSRQGVLGSTLCDQYCRWLAIGWWFSPGRPIFPTNKTDRYDIAGMKVSGHVFVCSEYRCCLFPLFELFRQCGTFFCFSIYPYTMLIHCLSLIFRYSDRFNFCILMTKTIYKIRISFLLMTWYLD